MNALRTRFEPRAACQTAPNAATSLMEGRLHHRRTHVQPGATAVQPLPDSATAARRNDTCNKDTQHDVDIKFTLSRNVIKKWKGKIQNLKVKNIYHMW